MTLILLLAAAAGVFVGLALARSRRERREWVGPHRPPAESAQSARPNPELLEALEEGVIELDRDLRVLALNAAARRLLGVRGERPIGSLAELWRSPAVESLVRKDVAGTVEVRWGEPPRVLAATLVPSAAGPWLVVCDRTALDDVERRTRELLANLSHELRTPTAVILANIELLETAGPDEPRDALIAGIRRHAERQRRLVEDVLDLARVEAGKLPRPPEAVELRPIAEDLGSLLGVRAAARGVTLDLSGLSGTVRADAHGVERILFNLLDNALKYAGQGAKVVARAVPRTGVVRILVEDDGPGIEVGHRPRLFERFYRVDGGRGRAEGGAGLGLAIVRSLSQSMGGASGYDPVEPHGSAFWVELPGAVISAPRLDASEPLL